MFQNPELKIDKELEDLLYTDADCTPLFVPLLLRKLRRSAGEKKVKCGGCNARTNGVIEGERSCPYCEGAGYLWDESIINGWIYRETYIKKVAHSSGTPPLKIGESDFYTSYLLTDKNLEMYPNDYIRQFLFNSDGTIAVPVSFRQTFKIIESVPLASNQRNTEFNISKLTTTLELARYNER